MIEFDVILDRIGHFGRYQLMITLMTYWLGVPAGLHNIASVFYGASVSYRCNVPPIDNSSIYPNLTNDDILNLTTPYDKSSEKYNTCKRYGYNLTKCDGTLDCVNKTSLQINCDMGYNFDKSVFTSTVDTQWENICDKKILNTLVTSLYFVGMWAGAIIFGYTSDNFGRRPTMMICSIGTLVFGVLTSVSPWFAMFAVCRIFVAMFSHGAFLIMCIYVMEISGKFRTPVGINIHVAFSIGYMFNSLIAYYLRDWRLFYLAISLSPIPYFIFHFFVPESPRWHFSNSRDDEGKALAHKFARHNRKKLTPDVWKEAETTQTDMKEDFDRKYSSLDLFKTPKMRLITINLMFSWFVVSLVYYGLSLNSGSLAGNIFINNAINGAMEIVACIIVTFTLDRFGRRILLAGSFILGGLACIGSMLCDQLANGNQVLTTFGVVMAFIGKIGASAGFCVIFNFTAELYPTVVRSNGLGFGSSSARLGSIFTPFVILVQDYAPWFPSSLFGVLSLIAGCLTFYYPETNGRTMPQTIPEAELFYKGEYSVVPSDEHTNSENSPSKAYNDDGDNSCTVLSTTDADDEDDVLNI